MLIKQKNYTNIRINDLDKYIIELRQQQALSSNADSITIERSSIPQLIKALTPDMICVTRERLRKLVFETIQTKGVNKGELFSDYADKLIDNLLSEIN